MNVLKLGKLVAEAILLDRGLKKGIYVLHTIAILCYLRIAI